MARTALNPALLILSGHLGEYVFRHQPDGSITIAPISRPRPNYQPSEAQLAQKQRFKLAAAHYRRLMQDPATKTAYQRLCAARGPMARLNALVMGDIMKPPVIRILNLSNYHGLAGGIIHVVAEDNVAVSRLSLSIHDLTIDADVETAEKVLPIEQLAGTVEWFYTTKTPSAPQALSGVSAAHTLEVRVTACDLAGNQTTESRVL